jgi:uncharacterized membrane protein YcaP (DUF421 family)
MGWSTPIGLRARLAAVLGGTVKPGERGRCRAMWNDVLVIGIPIVEKIVRTVVVYACIVALLRVVGKRDMAQLNTFDLVVMLLLSNVVQNAIIGPDNSVTGALIGAMVLLGCNSLLVRAAATWPRLGTLLEGTPTVLATDGVYDGRAMNRLGLSATDLEVAVKRQGGDRLTDISQVTLEPGGALLVRLHHDHENASVGDIQDLVARLDRIEAALAELNRRK